MSADYDYTTCRHCLGHGCLHCNHRGQFRRRVHSSSSRKAAAIRATIFGGIDQQQALRASVTGVR